MDTINSNVPALRFKEFEDVWDFKFGNEIFDRISNKNHNSDLPILAISQEFGAIPRDKIDYKISVTKDSIASYKVVEIGDFIISLRSFQGGIEYSNYKGICSPAYIILRPKLEITDYFYKYYLKSYKYIQELKRKLEGIRDGKMISYKYFSEIKLPIPKISEQTKIANFLYSIDIRLQQLHERYYLLQNYKKGSLQQIFSQQVRFKRDNGEDFKDWQEKRLGTIATRSITKNKDNKINLVLTNSATKGVISQNDYFDKDIANQNNLEGYYIIEKNDFVYNPRISVSAPVGPIKRNHLTTGVMSPLYTVFRFKTGILSYYEYFFEATSWFKYMKSVANYGVRFDRMNISTKDFLNMPIAYPSIEEQTKIANFLLSIDNKLNTVSEQIAQLEAYKRGLLQQMFV